MSELHHMLALTKLHIAQHYEGSEKIFTDPETFKYFQACPQKKEGPLPTKLPTRLPATSPQKTKPISKTAPSLQKSGIKEQKPTDSSSNPVPIQREKLKPSSPPEFSDIREILQKYFPSLELHNSPPDDTKAQEKALLWQRKNDTPEIVLLHETLSPSEHLFLQNLARAIETVFSPATLIPHDQLDRNSSYRLVISSNASLSECQHPHLEIGPIDRFLQNPLSKAQLWLDIKNMLLSS